MILKMTVSVGRCFKRTTMLVWVKEDINKNFNLPKPFNLEDFYTPFRLKHSDLNIGSQSSVPTDPNGFILAGSKMTHSVCVWSAHQNIELHVDGMDWDLTYKDLIKLTLFCPKYFHEKLFVIIFISQSFTKPFFNCNIIGSPYVEMLLKDMIKLLFLFFLSDCNASCASCNLWRF